MHPKVSVVVPVYNVERYIRKCLDSIIGQSYQDFEMILVDDGSPDDCPKICDRYAEKDTRIKVIHKENGGLVSAWMCGLDNSSSDSEFVTFIDPDDWVAERYIEAMVAVQEKTDADIVLVGTKKEDQGHMYEVGFTIPVSFYDERSLINDIYPIMLNSGDFESRSVPISRWGKLIRKQFIYPNLKYCSTSVTYAEDLNIIFPILLDVKSMALIDDVDAVYFYRVSLSSMLNSYDRNMLRSIGHVYPSLLQICKDKDKTEFIPQVYADYLAASVQYFKNELQNPGGLKEAHKNIRDFIADNSLLKKALQTTDWKRYSRRLNKMIIWAMCDYHHFNKYILTSLLCILKKYKIWRYQMTQKNTAISKKEQGESCHEKNFDHQ